MNTHYMKLCARLKNCASHDQHVTSGSVSSKVRHTGLCMINLEKGYAKELKVCHKALNNSTIGNIFSGIYEDTVSYTYIAIKIHLPLTPSETFARKFTEY